MSLPFPTDNLVQLSYASFPFATPKLENYTTSNYVIATSNTLPGKINLKQDTLRAATNRFGVGSAITALDYTKITLNKPTDFQANWNTIVINKPSLFPADMTNIYTKTETNGLIDGKQPTLTAATNLLGTGGSITNSNYYTIANRLKFASPLSSNVATNDISISLINDSTTN